MKEIKPGDVVLVLYGKVYSSVDEAVAESQKRGLTKENRLILRVNEIVPWKH
ncbi:MAG: hypothetical protein PHO90_02525 [Candidatus Pacebacteria bacterium]|nr:hypothetical protein [Candidatus Paceibacterota bacterium]